MMWWGTCWQTILKVLDDLPMTSDVLQTYQTGNEMHKEATHTYRRCLLHGHQSLALSLLRLWKHHLGPVGTPAHFTMPQRGLYSVCA